MNRKQLYVICANDFPHCILPEGTTVEQASNIITRLKSEEANRNPRDPWVEYYVRAIDICDNPSLLFK